MLLSLSSLFLSLIVYHYCYDDKTPLLQCSAHKEYESDCLDNRLNYETLTTHSYRPMSYGTWLSPISSALIVENTITPSEIRLDENGNAYWLELRPSESGRYVICSNKQPEQKDILEKPFNSRTRVHEYGGGSYLVKDDVVYFSNFADQRLYQINTKENNVPVPITEQSENASLRYADFTVDSFRKRLVCVHEVHQGEHDVQNSIASVSLNDSSIVTLASGYDFYSSPRISPDGRYLVWICWNHPNMPWDQTELWIGEFSNEDNSSLINKKKLFGQTDESILQPEWSPDGKFIYFVSDKNDWWNIYRASVDGQNVEHVYDDQAEFGGPSWLFAGSYYGFDSNGNLVSVYWKNGTAKLCRIDVQTKKSTPLTATEEYTDIRSVRVNNQTVYFVGSSAVKPAEVVEYNFETNTKNVLFRSTNITIDTRYLSVPEMITFKTGNDIAYGIYYPPKNDDYPLPESSTELPPLLVRTHGGPTAATTSAFNLRIQYWTSRGFALLDVNYRGSTGYGRKFRDSLRDHWGIYDVQDAIAGAEHLVQQNKVDRNRLTIDGGSAGGYTTLCALTMYDFFSAGASHYGVSDLELLAKDTHKFESRYLDRLVGEYPAKQDIYIERSPMTHVKKVSKPIIFFQGSEDKIVLPSQAEVMVNALREKHLPVAYVLFDGEQHGFRKAENIRRSLDGQFYFFSRIFRFQMADRVEPIEIENFSDDQ